MDISLQLYLLLVNIHIIKTSQHVSPNNKSLSGIITGRNILMLKHTVNNCMLQHYCAPCVNILSKDGYYHVKNAGEQLAGNNYIYSLHRRCTISNYNCMSHITVITSLRWFYIFYIFIFL